MNHASDEWRRRLSACVDTEADILNITYDYYSQNNTVKMANCNFDNWRLLLLFSFALNANEQRIITFLTEKCYLNLQSKVRT